MDAVVRWARVNTGRKNGWPVIFEWDDAVPDDATLRLLLIAGSCAVIWGGNYFTLPLSRKFLVWDKGAGFGAEILPNARWHGVPGMVTRRSSRVIR